MAFWFCPPGTPESTAAEYELKNNGLLPPGQHDPGTPDPHGKKRELAALAQDQPPQTPLEDELLKQEEERRFQEAIEKVLARAPDAQMGQTCVFGLASRTAYSSAWNPLASGSQPSKT